jgi:16S rRNA G527 N7-methylase RsmG
LAVALPDRRFALVEARRRRGAFLEMAVAELGLRNVSVMVQRIETLGSLVDVCFARALAPALQAWDTAEPLLRPHGRLVYFAGASWDHQREKPALQERGAFAEICSPKRLKWQGPLVMIGRSPVNDGSHDHRPTHV